MNYVFGPVPSRRLGQSLGIDTIPHKTCNWNCVYCQLGRTVPLTNKRREYFPPDDILAEVEDALAKIKPGEVDWLTFVGSGEPTLHQGIGWLITQVKSLTDLPIAVITNGSLLAKSEVRKDLMLADAVMPSLDAGNPILFRKVNRPWPRLNFIEHLNGLISFQNEYSGLLWIEVMLIKGLNDSQDNLEELAQALGRIRPDEVHINLPTRPPAETWVKPPDMSALRNAFRIFGDISKVVQPTDAIIDLNCGEEISDEILSIIARHPVREHELISMLRRLDPVQAETAMQELASSGLTQIVERHGDRFWTISGASYSKV